MAYCHYPQPELPHQNDTIETLDFDKMTEAVTRACRAILNLQNPTLHYGVLKKFVYCS